MASSEDVFETTKSFLANRPNTADDLEHILEVDSAQETWRFDDISIDSGTFGEIVSRGIVETVDDGYRVSAPEAVEAAVSGRTLAETDSIRPTSSSLTAFRSNISIDFLTAGALFVTLAIMGIMRALPFPNVYREGLVISPANDPYYYRYVQYEMMNLADEYSFIEVLGAMPETRVRPLSHATNWIITEILGGTDFAAELVAAWLPIVASIFLGVVVFFFAKLLTNDSRIAIGAVLMLALTPVHTIYTSIGFLEHRLHQYFWVGVLGLTLLWFAVDLQRRHETTEVGTNVALDQIKSPITWIIVGIFALTVGLTPHFWGGSPLHFIPVAAVIGLRVVQDIRSDISPGLSGVPIVVGLGVGSIISHSLHTNFGWHEPFAVYTPLLILGGTVGVMLGGEIWRQVEFPPVGFLGVEIAIAIIGFGTFWRLRPEDVMRLQSRVDDLFQRDIYTESVSLFAVEYAYIFGPLVQMGPQFFLALIPLGVASWIVIKRFEPAWLVAVTFTWYYMVLAAIQVRFAAQLAIFLSVFASIGLLYILSTVDLAQSVSPFTSVENRHTRRIQARFDTSKVLYLTLALVLLIGLNLIFIPGLQAQTIHSDDAIKAISNIEDHAMATNRSYPENFVLSRWPENRMYNFFVNGESRSYSYAQRTHDNFVMDGSPDDWFDEFDGRVGYVVLMDREMPAGSTHAKLFGNNEGDHANQRHYQAVYIGDDVRAYAIVPGARINTTGVPNQTVSVSTTVTINDETIQYNRTADVNADGYTNIYVAYPGEYTISNQSIYVSEMAVETGKEIDMEME